MRIFMATFCLCACLCGTARAQDIVMPNFDYKAFCKGYAAKFGGFDYAEMGCLRSEEGSIKFFAEGKVSPTLAEWEGCLKDSKTFGQSYLLLRNCLVARGQQAKGELPPKAEAAPAPSQPSKKANKEQRPVKGHEQAFLDEVFQNAFTFKPKEAKKYYRLEYTGDGQQKMTVNVYVSTAPKNMDEVRFATDSVLEGLVKTLVSWGYEPAKGGLNIYCVLLKNEKGLSGKNVVRMYGQSNYRPETDSAEFMLAR